MPQRLVRSTLLAASALLALAPPAVLAAAPVVQAQASGEVVRVDAAAGKVTIRHGAIAALDLPAMTLVYHVDPALLAGLKRGDKVQFTAERTGGQYRITQIKK